MLLTHTSFVIYWSKNSKQDVGGVAIYSENAAQIKSKTDYLKSNASNQIYLNWNAPLTFVSAFIEAKNN